MLGKAVRRVSTGLSLCGSLGRYLGLEAARWSGGSKPRPVHLRYNACGAVWMRNGTTDYPTLVSCFVKGFHRPLQPLPPRPTILDIGANVGYTLVDFRHHHPDARLIGVEMDADNHALASRNVEGLGNVQLLRAAVWCEDGEVRYDASADADAFAVGSGGAAQRSVEALTMGTLLDRCGVSRADYVKLDIEGAEKDLFERGELGWLQRVEQISIELHGTLKAPELMALLREHGFQAAKDARHWDTVVAWRSTAGTAAQ
ncbi:FkbM family methyltransferase [Variovorax sp. YR752]|uniref:FkbM family methyltransferase n=1 Tax=Variovorax sp. YR752 TaxID=1884383 RepID=UPI003137AD08